MVIVILFFIFVKFRFFNSFGYYGLFFIDFEAIFRNTIRRFRSDCYVQRLIIN